MAPRRKPAAVAIPTLTPCPDCGLGMEPGAGPHGLAFHECRRADAVSRLLDEQGTITPEDAQQALMRILLERVKQGRGTVAEIAEVFERIAPRPSGPTGKGGGGKDGPSTDMLGWLNEEEP